jgi:hypothetical protein
MLLPSLLPGALASEIGVKPLMAGSRDGIEGTSDRGSCTILSAPNSTLDSHVERVDVTLGSFGESGSQVDEVASLEDEGQRLD